MGEIVPSGKSPAALPSVHGPGKTWGDSVVRDGDPVVSVPLSQGEWHVMVEVIEYALKHGPRKRNNGNLINLARRFREAAPGWEYSSGEARWGRSR